MLWPKVSFFSEPPIFLSPISLFILQFEQWRRWSWEVQSQCWIYLNNGTETVSWKFYVPPLAYGRWITNDRTRRWRRAVEMSFLCTVAETEELGHLKAQRGEEPAEVLRASEKVFQTCPSRGRPRNRPKTCWRGCKCRLAWDRHVSGPHCLGCGRPHTRSSWKWDNYCNC